MADVSTPEKLKKRSFGEFVPQMQYKARKLYATRTFPVSLSSAQNRLKKSTSLEIKPNVGNLDCKNRSESMSNAEDSLPDPDSVEWAESLLDLDTLSDVALPDSDALTGNSPLFTTVEVDVKKVLVSDTTKSSPELRHLEPRELVDFSVTFKPLTSNLSQDMNASKLFGSIGDSHMPGCSKPEGKEVDTSSVVQLPVESVEKNMYKYPRRSISAHRDFPVGCGRKAYNCKGIVGGVLQYVDVKEKSVRKLKQMDTEETSLKLPVENIVPRSGLNTAPSSVNVYKRIETSAEKIGWKDMNRSDMSLEGNYSGKTVDKMHAKNQSQVEKHSMSEPSKEKVNVQAPIAASNFPLKQGKQTCKSRTGLTQPSTKSISNVDTQAVVARNKVKQTLSLFHTIFRELSVEKQSESKEPGHRRIDCKAADILKKNNKLVNSNNQKLGAIPGVEVGDEFHYRVELAIIGLHRPYQGGIDYMKRSDGKILATSIVASGGYDDYKKSSDVFVYSGQGGNPTRGSTVATDQKLVRGNLALKNSMDEQTPVRVIRGFEEAKANNSLEARMNRPATLTYDGLYLVEKYWKEKGRYGTDVFMFQLRKISDQQGLLKK